MIHALNRITTARASNLKFAEYDSLYLPSISPHFHYPDTENQPEVDFQQPPAPLRVAPTARIPMVMARPMNDVPAAQVPAGVVPALPLPQGQNALSANAQLIVSKCDIAECYRMSPSDPIEVLAAEVHTGPIPLPKDEIEALAARGQQVAAQVARGNAGRHPKEG